MTIHEAPYVLKLEGKSMKGEGAWGWGWEILQPMELYHETTTTTIIMMMMKAILGFLSVPERGSHLPHPGCVFRPALNIQQSSQVSFSET